MSRSSNRKFIAVVATVGLLLPCLGCARALISGGTALVAGLLLGNKNLTSVSQECYENGVLIDCADLPDGLNQ